MAKEKIGVEMLVQPKLDARETARFVKDWKAIQKEAASTQMDYKALSKSSESILKKIKGISASAALFSRELSGAAKASFQELSKLGKELEGAQKKASDLKKRYESAGSKEEKSAAAAEMGAVEKHIAGLTKQINDHRKVNRQYGTEVKNVIKAQKAYQAELKRSAQYTGKNFGHDMASALRRTRGGVGGALGGVSSAVTAGAKFSKGVQARTALSAADAGSLTKAVTGLSRAVPVLAGAMAALTAFWQLLKAASEHQTKLNKAILEGTGTANDFTSATDQYMRSVNDLRVAARDNAKDFLKFGADSEQLLKIVNRYAVESTGSLMKTRNTLAEMGSGDVAAGMNQMAKSAIAYGKALGMEATEVGAMMGKLETEAGYAHEQVQGLMSNIVKSAATANMPMTKFMGIFRTVLPDVELYQNRLEELTGTIKLLSKTMSPKDVKKFMDAFSSGFKGMDFKQRLKTALVVGVGNVSHALDKDFSAKAAVMAQNFQKYGIQPEEFQKAYKGGEKAMAELVAKAQGRAAEQGTAIAGTVIGDAMKLASYEGARRKGGALNTATAMRGAGQYATYNILKQMSQRFTKGFDGLSEHVIKQLGISEEQYDAMRTTALGMKGLKAQLGMFGKTNSRSLNASLRQQIALAKGIEENQVTGEMMAKATEEQLFYASEQSNIDKDTAQTAGDLATQQVTATTSIADKLDNVIAFILEKIYGALEGILSIFDDVWQWLVGDEDEKAAIKRIGKFSDSIQASGYGAAEKQNIEALAQHVSKGVSLGKGGGDLGKFASKFYDPKMMKENAKAVARDVGRLGEMRGMSATDAATIQNAFYKALKKGDLASAFATLEDIPGDMAMNLMQFGQNIMPDVISDEDRKRAKEGKGPMRRAGAEIPKSFATKKEYDKFIAAQKEASDVEEDMVALTKKQMKQPVALAGQAGPVSPAIAAAMNAGGGTGAMSKYGTGSAKDPLTKGSFEQVQKEAANDQVKATEDVYGGVKDTTDLLKRGIRYETSFLGGPWKNTVKAATLSSFRDALIEFAIIQSKMGDADFKKFMTDYSYGVTHTDPDRAMGALMEMVPGGVGPSNEAWSTFQKKSKQMGGPVPDTGMYKLHRGEYVVPAMPSGRGGRGGSTINAMVNINGSDLSEQELEGAVYGALERIARRH